MVNELILDKKTTLKKIEVKRAEIIAANQLLKHKENQILLNTDFKELKLTNEKMRNAYIHEQLSLEKNGLEWLKYDLTVLENELDLINTLLLQGE